ncbi:SPOR domain-containing protein [Echinicola vietnamensis]|uniref:Cell division protein n=1 Tax=Echinicola vietnamensis (strain DSM 17526 / LMG 23754 / KMM 6221) TaxID=926556 RepID=L0G0H6_ECHVK|nr:SPOR domain-containing protein [Echinicola vietnamensis]AGA79694.1 cell division protein [Echinicola vietnamensis DSM 17526]
MTDKDQGKKAKRKDEDKDFGLPEIEITPISSEEAKSESRPSVIPVPTGESADTKSEKEPEKDAPSEKQEAPVIPEPTPSSTFPDNEEKDEKSNKAGWIILLLLLLGLLGFGVYHFVIKGPEQPEVPEPVAVQPEVVEPEPEIPETPTTPPADETSQTPSLTEISEKGDAPHYFVTVGAFIDGDLAKDFSDRLNKQGYNTYIVLPGYGSSFYKLAIEDFDNVDDALAMIEREQENFEETLWVFKY